MSALGKNSFFHAVGGSHRKEAGIRVRQEKALPMESGVGLSEGEPWIGLAKPWLSQAK